MSDTKKLLRSKKDRIIAGVCSGLSDYFDIDVTIVRLIFVIGAIAGFGSFILIYFVMILIVPEASNAANETIIEVEEVRKETVEDQQEDTL